MGGCREGEDGASEEEAVGAVGFFNDLISGLGGNEACRIRVALWGLELRYFANTNTNLHHWNTCYQFFLVAHDQ